MLPIEHWLWNGSTIVNIISKVNLSRIFCYYVTNRRRFSLLILLLFGGGFTPPSLSPVEPWNVNPISPFRSLTRGHLGTIEGQGDRIVFTPRRVVSLNN